MFFIIEQTVILKVKQSWLRQPFSLKKIMNNLSWSCDGPFFQILSIDYDQLSDEFLSKLDAANGLERLIVHLHSIQNDHPGTTNKAWENFCVKHSGCKLRLTIIHAFNDIESLHERVLQPEMPLSHLKVFFCEKVSFVVEIGIFLGKKFGGSNDIKLFWLLFRFFHIFLVLRSIINLIVLFFGWI